MQHTRLLMQLNTLNTEKRTWNMLKIDGETELKKRSLKIDQLMRENESLRKKLNGEKENSPSYLKKVNSQSFRKERAASEVGDECKQQ